MKKNNIHISDAIPQRPASFDETVERTLERVCQKEQKKTPSRAWKTENGEQRKRGSRRSAIDYVIGAAVIVACVAIIGGAIAIGPRLKKNTPAEAIEAAQPIETVQPIETIETIETVKTVSVSTVEEFLAAIAPDTRIVLADGTYNLADAADYGTAGKQYYTWVDRSDNWFREKEENSFELSIQNVSNLTVTGSKNAEIVTMPRTAAVLSLQNCPGLRLSGFTAGHTVASDPCEGEVVRLVECADARIENCSLYGCGAWGVNAVDCDDLVLSGTDIYECSEGGVMFVRCRNALMTECKVRNCGYRDDAFSLFYVFDCQNLKITACDVYENRTDAVFTLVDDDVLGTENVFLLGTSVYDNTVLGEVFHSNTETGPFVAGCEFRNNDGVLLPDDQHVYGLGGNRLTGADLLAMQLDRTVDVDFNALPTPAPEPSEEPTPEPVTDPVSDALCLFFDTDLYYAPYENWIWTDQDDGLCADGMSFADKIEAVKDKIPTIYNPAALTVKAGDGVKLEPQLNVYDAECNPVAHDGEISIRTLEPGTYYVSQRVSRRETDRTSGYQCVVRVVIGDPNPAPETTPAPTPEPIEEPPMQESSTIPSAFRFWNYEDENAFYEAPLEGVLFVCDFDSDGTEEEITYEIKKTSIRIKVLGQSTEVKFGEPHEYLDGVYEAILVDLDAESPTLNLVLVYYSWESGCDSIELHTENGKLVKGTNVSNGWAFLGEDGKLLMKEDTDLFGTQEGVRTYSGDGMHPDSEWLTLVDGVTEQTLKTDREELIERGKLLHLVRDLPCTIDGEAVTIPAESYLWVLRYHESETKVEIMTEDGTVALVTMQRADKNDPDLYGFLIDGVMQEEYFDNIFFAG